MGISLMAYIPDDLIERSIENIMNGYRQFNCAQAGTQVTGIGGDHIDDELPDLPATPGKIFNLQLPEVCRVIYQSKKVANLCSHLPGLYKILFRISSIN